MEFYRQFACGLHENAWLQFVPGKKTMAYTKTGTAAKGCAYIFGRMYRLSL